MTTVPKSILAVLKGQSPTVVPLSPSMNLRAFSFSDEKGQVKLFKISGKPQKIPVAVIMGFFRLRFGKAPSSKLVVDTLENAKPIDIVDDSEDEAHVSTKSKKGVSKRSQKESKESTESLKESTKGSKNGSKKGSKKETSKKETAESNGASKEAKDDSVAKKASKKKSRSKRNDNSE